MSIAINQLPTLLSSTLIFMFILLLILMSIKLMQTYRNKGTHLLLISGLVLVGIQHSLVLYNFQSDMSLLTYIISTATGMLSFIIINYVLMNLSLDYGTVKPFPYILFGLFIIASSITSYFLAHDQPLAHLNGYGLPILELCYIVILVVLMSQVKNVSFSTYHLFAVVMQLVNIVSYLFHYYLVGEFTLWLHITQLLSTIIYFIFVFLLLFGIVTQKLIKNYRTYVNDSMTGLYLRQNFLRKVSKLGQTKPIAIIFSDIDNFKQLNDTKGHLEADQILIKVAQIIKHETAPFGYAGRYGGEEIVAGIVITNVKPEDIAEKIRKRIAEETGVTVSVGVSTSKDSGDLQQLLKFADDAMYYAKTTGKNKVCMYKSLPASLKNK